MTQAAINLLQESELTESQPTTHTHTHTYTYTHAHIPQQKKIKQKFQSTRQKLALREPIHGKGEREIGRLRLTYMH